MKKCILHSSSMLFTLAGEGSLRLSYKTPHIKEIIIANKNMFEIPTSTGLKWEPDLIVLNAANRLQEGLHPSQFQWKRNRNLERKQPKQKG